MVLHVSKTGAPGHYATISAAIVAAAPGETIIVGDGVYEEDVVISKSLTLLSENGQWNEGAGTGVKIVGIEGGALGTVTVSATSGVTVGDIGQGFTIIGKDGPTTGIEASAVYLQGSVSNITLRGNDVVANGDGGLTSEYGETVSNVTIDNNIFSGQTFNGIPYGQGSAEQWTQRDVPRQLVVMGGVATSAISFTNNQITGIAGGINAQNQEQGNSLVTLDVVNSVISGNTFTGFTNYGGYALRVRRDGTSITNNTFDSEASGSDNTSQVLVQTANPGMSSGNNFVGSDNNDIIYATAGAGSDSYDGGDGVDTFSFTPAATTGAVADLQSGFAFSGSTGYDTLANIENLVGTAGNDTFLGDANDNTFFATSGTDSVNGRGTGDSDTFDSSAMAGNTTVNLTSGSASGYGGTTTLSNVENATTGGGNDTLIGNSGANVLIGNGGNDTFTGNGGGDTIVGGSGLDIVNYGAVAADDFELDGMGGWSVDTGTGTDTLAGVEQVHSAGSKILLVGNGGYATIQEAINAAADGDTVLIADGVYSGDLTITDKAISLVGVGDVEIQGEISISDDMELGDILTFRNITIDATNENYGIKARIDSVGNFGKIVLDGVTIENARQNGFFYANSLNDSNPLSTATLGAVEISDSVFHNNGYIHTGSAGRGHINLYGYNGDLTVNDSMFTTEAGRPDTAAPGVEVAPHKAISVSGVRDGSPGVGPYLDGGDVAFSNVTITGNYSTDVVSFYHIKEFDSATFTDVTITARGPWGLVNADSVGGTFDVSGIAGTNSYDDPADIKPTLGADLKGLASDDTLTGTDGDDRLIGRGGADVLEGGAGNDLIIGGSVHPSTGVVSDDANSVIDTAVFDGGSLSWNGSNWIVTDGGEVDILVGVERVTIGGDTYLLVDKSSLGGFSTIQSAIDAAVGEETILIAEGDYSESSNYNPANNTNTLPSNPVGLLINKSVTLQGVNADGAITDADDVVATILPAVQSNWGTQIFVTAPNVSIIGLGIEALSTVAINKIVEVVADNFTLSGSKVGAADDADIGAAIYVNDRVATSDPGFVSEIATLTIDGNVLEGDIAITNGAGYNRTNPALNITNNTFVLNEGADDFWNWGIIITGQDTAVAWRLADVAIPNVSGNTFTQGYTGDRILFVRGDNTAALVDAADLDAFLSLNNTGTYAYVTAPGGALRYIQTGTTEGFAVHRFAGNASADALAGDTLVVSSGSNNDTQIITVDDLTVVALEGSTDLNIELGAGIETVTIGDYAVGEGEDVTVTGSAGDNTITGNSGDNLINGAGGSDDLLGGDGNDTFVYDTAADFGATESVDGGDATGIDSIEFRASANETLVLNADVTGIEAVFINSAPGVDAGVDASAVTNALAMFGDDGDNTFTGTAFNDSFDGGDEGVDTVIDSGAVVLNGTQWGLDTNTDGLADQTLTDIEIVDNGSGFQTLLVGAGGFATIQEAIDAAGVGDTILIAAGNYTEKLVISTNGLTLQAVGEVNILGTLHADLNIAANASTTDFFEAASAYSTPTAGTGITVSGSGITLSGLNVNGFHYGINLGEGTTDLLIDGVDIIHTIVGINKSTAADIADITINDGSITDTYQGIVFAKSTSTSDGFATGITIDGTLFEDLGEKGIYVETLTNSTIRNVTMNNVGQFGRGDAFGDVGQWGAGIDINLKYGTYTGTILIEDFDFTDVGLSNGAGSSHIGGAAITIKGRDDANGYNGIPAIVSGLTVTVQNGTINGTSTGIRLGEPGKPNSGVNVTGPHLSVTNVVIDNAQFELDNVSKSVLTVTLDANDDNAYDASNAATATGSIVFNGNALANTFTGAKGNDVFNGNGGADVFNGGDGNDTANFTSSAEVALATFNGGDGTDTIAFNTASETNIDLGTVVLNSVERVTIGGAAANLDASDKTVGLTLVGSASANIIIGTSGDDTIQGMAGNDTVKYVLGQGSDSFDGGNDVDTFEVDGKAAASSTTYGLTAAGAVLTLATGASTQTLTNVEKLKIELSALGDKVTLAGDLATAGIVGASAEIRIDAGLGNDVVNAAGITGAAKLIVELGDGDDTFIGGRVDQTVKGGAGLKDTFDFGQASGGVNFNLGTGTLMGAGIGGISSGNTGFEHVRGSGFNDILNGSATTAAEETFYASLGDDLINGRNGADTYSGTYTRPDGVKESIGHALYVNLEDGFATDLATTALFTHALVNIENIVGSGFDDWLVGSSGNNVIDGEAGDDILEGGQGDDTYIANSVGDVVVEEVGGGTDTVITSRGRNYELWDNVENLTLTAGTTAWGNGLDNTIIGNASNNVIDGRSGADAMSGGDGNDSYYVDNIGDQVIETSGNGDDIVYSTVNFILGDHVERLNLTGSANVNATGNALDNIIRGNSGANTITGGLGADVMTGGSGNDVFVFNTGDTLMGAARDRVTDFKHLLDDLDLTNMAAGTFTYVGEKADFGTITGAAKVRWFVEGANTIVEGDANGDGVGDFQIQLDGNNLGLTFNDFLL